MLSIELYDKTYACTRVPLSFPGSCSTFPHGSIVTTQKTYCWVSRITWNARCGFQGVWIILTEKVANFYTVFITLCLETIEIWITIFRKITPTYTYIILPGTHLHAAHDLQFGEIEIVRHKSCVHVQELPVLDGRHKLLLFWFKLLWLVHRWKVYSIDFFAMLE